MQSVLLVVLVFAHSLHSTHISIRDEGSLKIEDEVPEACRKLTYCTVRPPNYPIEVREEIEPHILRKRSGLIELNDDCHSEVSYEVIYKIRENTNDIWRTVAHAGDVGPKIRLEVCRMPERPCFIPFLQTPGYRTFCKQNFADLEMRVLSPYGNGTELIKTQLPVACSCKYQALV